MRIGMCALWSMIALVAACQRYPAPAYPGGTYPQAYSPGYAAGAFDGSWVTQGGAMTLQEQNGAVTGTIQSGSLQGTVQGVVRTGQLDLLLSMSDGSSSRFVAYSDGNQLTIRGPQPLVFVRPGGSPTQVGLATAPPGSPPAPQPAPQPVPPPSAPAPERGRHTDRAVEGRGQVGLVTGCFRSSTGSGAVWVERTLYFDGSGRFSKQGPAAGRTTEAGRGDGGTYAVTGKRVRLAWSDGTTASYDLVYENGKLGALQNGNTWYLRCN